MPFPNIILHREEIMHITKELCKQSVGLVVTWWSGVWRFAVIGIVKLALEAGKATPAPPVGPALGSKGVNIMAFCKEYNAKTADKPGYVIPVEITVFDVSGD